MNGDATTLQVLINAGFTLFGVVLVLLLTTIFKRIGELSKRIEETVTKLNDTKVILASKYIAKPDFQHLMDVLFAKLERIEEKIDRKQDK